MDMLMLASRHCPEPLPDHPARLSQLATALQSDLEVLSYPSRNWDYSRGNGILEVAIIGAGCAGKSLAFGLRRYGITNVQIVDQCSPGLAGPWRTTARNHTLRTPKNVSGGMDWGIPNLNVQRWCEAKYGRDYWDTVAYIPRQLWAEYLDWYEQVLNLPIHYQTPIHDITWDPGQQVFQLHAPDRVIEARFVILASGLEAAGGKKLPALVEQHLPAQVYAHTADVIEFEQLQGKRVAVMGGGASAFDNALMASYAGAQQIDILVRRSQMPILNRIRWSEWNGYHRHYIELEDADKWQYTFAELELGQLPPPHTYQEVMRDPRIRVLTGAPLQQVRYEQGCIQGQYGPHHLEHDFLICGTGYHTDITQCPELGSLAKQITLWKDRYTPPSTQNHAGMAHSPYLGSNLELVPRDPAQDYLRRIFCLTGSVTLLSGFRANLSSLQFVAPRICHAIGGQLFQEHQPEIRAAFDSYNVPEF